MNKKRLIPVLIIAIVVAAVLLFRRNGETDGRILLSGNIELLQVDISFKTAGKLIERAAEEGENVKKGQLLARIDREQLTSQQAREAAGLAAAQSGLAQLHTAIQFQAESIEGDEDLRRAELRAAEARLEELTAGSRPQEIQTAEAVVAEARTQHEQARRDWERAQTLYKNDDISTAQHDQYRSRFEATQAALRRAGEQLALVKEGPRKEQIESARAQVARARAALRLSEASKLELKRRRQEVDARKADVDRARAQVAIVGSQLDDTVAHSPVDGVVLVKSADPGEVLAAGTTVLTVGDLERPWLRGYINEKDLGRVKLGSKVKITSDSYPGKAYWGRVSFISSEAEFTPKQIQTREERVKLVYRIKVDVDNPQRELKLNMPVDAEILAGES